MPYQMDCLHLQYKQTRLLTNKKQKTMTTQELKRRMRIINDFGYNTYIIEVYWRGKYYHTRSHNSLAYDRIQQANWLNPATKSEGYTERQALQSMYDECIRDNYLGKYNY